MKCRWSISPSESTEVHRIRCQNRVPRDEQVKRTGSRVPCPVRNARRHVCPHTIRGDLGLGALKVVDFLCEDVRRWFSASVHIRWHVLETLHGLPPSRLSSALDPTPAGSCPATVQPLASSTEKQRPQLTRRGHPTHLKAPAPSPGAPLPRPPPPRP